MKKQKRITSIELLNSEGPILKAYKILKGYVIQDEYKELISVLNKEQLIDFIYDRMSLIDSKDKIFVYGNFPSSMKPDLRKLSEFVDFDLSDLNF
jgi:hypothetical protein